MDEEKRLRELGFRGMTKEEFRTSFQKHMEEKRRKEKLEQERQYAAYLSEQKGRKKRDPLIFQRKRKTYEQD